MKEKVKNKGKARARASHSDLNGQCDTIRGQPI